MMRKIPILFLALAVTGPLIAEDQILRDSQLYTAPTTMTDGTYTLRIQEAGVFERAPATDGVFTIDRDPFVVRDFTPPSRPEGVLASALNATTIRITYLAATDNIGLIDYRIYRDGAFLSFASDTTYTDTALNPVTIYHYNVQAVDRLGNRSPLSETVTVATLDPATQNSAPRFVIRPFVRYVSSTLAVVGFTTDKATVATVDYGMSTSYGSSVTQPDYLTEHIVSITGLTPGTRYHYRVSVNDFGAHGPVLSLDDTFYTLFGSDVSAPSYTDGPRVAYRSDTSAVITFTTNEDALGSVTYGVGSSANLQANEPFFDTAHAVTLSGLNPSTEYSYHVSIADRSGNGPVLSETRRFTTRQNPDGKGPEILRKPDIAYVTDKLAIITWETDELSDAAVRFGTRRDGPYDRLATSPAMTKEHLVILTNLSPDSKYFFVAWSTDPSGNASEESKEKLFTTNRSPDRNSPNVRNVQINAGSTSATIRWATEELSDAKLVYGTSPGTFTGQVYDGVLLKEHRVILQGLVTGTTYYFQILAKDPSGNAGQSRQYSFRTGANHGGGDHDGDDDHGGDNDDHGGGNDDDGGNNGNNGNNNGHGEEHGND